MPIDLSPLDAKIRKFQKLKELLSDSGTRDLLADPEIRQFIFQAVRSNGSPQSVDTAPEAEGQKPEKTLRPGTLLSEVFEATTALREIKEKFAVRDVVDTMKATGYKFAAKNPDVAVHSSLRKLAKHKFIRTLVKGKGRRPTIFGHTKLLKNSAA